MDKKQLFKDLCCARKPWMAIRKNVRAGNITIKDCRPPKFGEFTLRGNSAICRECKLPIESNDFAIWQCYGPIVFWFAAHKACRDVGMRREAWDVQNEMDRNCNDCRHYARQTPIDSNGISYGNCTKFTKSVKAHACLCMPMDCFEHRRPRP